MSAIRRNDTIVVRRLETRAEATEAVGPDVLYSMGMNGDYAHSFWATSDYAAVALVFAKPPDDEGWLVVMRGPARRAASENTVGEQGPGEPSINLVDTVRAEVGGLIGGLTVPRSPILAPALDRWKLNPGNDWDLMVCDEPPPPQPGESLVRNDVTEAEVQAFLDRVNPHHSVRADDPSVELWAGVRDEAGAVTAVGALTRRRTGVGYLASIATDPAVRGTGRGSAITAHLTRRVFDAGESQCTLAHYHPNESARRVYRRLGYWTLAQNYSAGFA